MSPLSSAADNEQPLGLNPVQLGAFIGSRRQALGISSRELARRAGIADVTRLELGQIPKPRTDTLAAIAQALNISLTELLGMGRPESLPSFRPYMRTKFPDMPDAALADIDAYVEKLAQKYRVSPSGPIAGEDEQDGS